MKFPALAILAASASATKLESKSPHIPGNVYDPNFMKPSNSGSMPWERELTKTHGAKTQ